MNHHPSDRHSDHPRHLERRAQHGALQRAAFGLALVQVEGLRARLAW